MLQFNKKYFLITIILFITEVLIALYVHDNIIRPYIGDLLVVILIYCFIKAFFKTSITPTVIGVLLFAYFVETLQYFRIIYHLGIDHSQLARVIIGSSFEWIDILAYTAGAIIVWCIEKVRTSRNPATIKQT